MVVIYMSYHVIWQSKTDLVIWQIYDRYMTGIWHRLSYDRHIPVISLDTTCCHIYGTYRHIPVIWHRELTCRMNHIWQFMSVVWLVAFEQAAPGAPARSRIALEMQRHTEFGLQGCLLCQCITQRVGATGQPSRRRWGKPPLQKTTQVATKSHRRRRQQW
jgi:hypothetical protein